MKLPNIHALANKGVRFTRAYETHSEVGELLSFDHSWPSSHVWFPTMAGVCLTVVWVRPF